MFYREFQRINESIKVVLKDVSNETYQSPHYDLAPHLDRDEAI